MVITMNNKITQFRQNNNTLCITTSCRKVLYKTIRSIYAKDSLGFPSQLLEALVMVKKKKNLFSEMDVTYTHTSTICFCLVTFGKEQNHWDERSTFVVKSSSVLLRLCE